MLRQNEKQKKNQLQISDADGRCSDYRLYYPVFFLFYISIFIKGIEKRRIPQYCLYRDWGFSNSGKLKKWSRTL